MTRGLPATLLAPLLLAACAAAPPAAAPDPGEWDRELPEGVSLETRTDGDGWQYRWAPMRVVDDATGAPVPGARIDNWWEADWPGAEPWEDCLKASYVTDGDGLALVPQGNHAQWFYVEAPGHAPLGEMGWEEEWRLLPGVDVPVEVRDWLDRPVPGVVVEHMLGCGHTPNVRVEVTDSEGRALLRGIDPDRGYLWVRGEGVLGHTDAYDGIDGLPLEDGVRIIRCDPSPAVEGVVLHADGTPAAGAFVGTRDLHRGPWTAAGPDGRFRLLGAPPYGLLTVDAPPPAGSPEGTEWVQGEFQSVPGVAATVRLPRPGEEQEEERELPVLRVRVWAEGDLDPVGSVRVVAVRDADGRAEVACPQFSWRSEEDGVEAVAEIPLEPGTWRVAVGTPGGLLTPSVEQEVEVGGEGAELLVGLSENPVLRPALIERREDGTLRQRAEVLARDFSILTADGREEAVPAAGEPGGFHVPWRGPFVVEYRGVEGPVRVLFPNEPGEREHGFPAFVLPPAPGDGDGMEMMTVPYEGDFPEARLTVRYPDGGPARFATVTVSGSTAPNLHYSQRMRLDGEGGMDFAFRRHDRVEVEQPYGEEDAVDWSLPPLVAFIDGPGPWSLAWPDTEITVRMVDPAGNPVEGADVHLPPPGDAVFAEGGVAVLHGAPTGPFRFWVGAEGYRARDLRLLLTAGEKRTVVAILNPTQSGDETGE